MQHHVDKVIEEFHGKLRSKALSSPNTDNLMQRPSTD